MGGSKKRKESLFIRSEKIQDCSISELKVRLQDVVERLNQLIKRVTEKTELAIFLIDICQASQNKNSTIMKEIIFPN